MEMPRDQKSVLLLSMPFAGTAIPSIQLPLLSGYCADRDVEVHTRHLYLEAAACYGINLYHGLIYPPNDSYTAQMIFSKYVFPEYYQTHQDLFKNYFQQKMSHDKNTVHGCSFDEYVQRTDVFYQWACKYVDQQAYDIVGFTLNYGQLLPSLALAKHIKEKHPETIVVCGGSRTMSDLGQNILKAFPYVDAVVSGEGEEPLYHLAVNTHFDEIPGLTYRKDNQIHTNPPPGCIDLNQLTFLDFDAFFSELKTLGGELEQYFSVCGRLPVEISRGCWWNHCTFCNLNVQYPTYREKNVERIGEEILWLSDRYKMLSFQLIGNTLPKQDYRHLCEHLIQQQKDFSFFVEARAGKLTSDDYRLLKAAGFHMIQTGIESFSTQYLKKMNKGTRVIDNIAALKFCKEHDIINKYNLMVRYPNEDHQDFEETVHNISFIHGYLDPPQLCHLRVLYGSSIYQNPEAFNIATIKSAPIDQIMYPPDILDQGIGFVFDFTKKDDLGDNKWEELVTQWQKMREQMMFQSLKSQLDVDRYILYFIDGGSFVKIFDKRDGINIRIYLLNKEEREVFLSCLDVISLKDLQHKLVDIPEFQLTAILQSFEQAGLVFREEDWYLSLPLRCHSASVDVKKETVHSVLSPQIV